MAGHAELIEQFYTAFAAGDAEKMVACYHADIEFADPVFQSLSGDRARGMWRMLCSRATDLKVTHSAVTADGDTGTAHWDAVYTFNTGRVVHNSIEARFEFADGLIRKHVDTFDLWKWTRMALGPAGALFGWLPPFQGAIRRKANGQLQKFLALQRQSG